MRIKPAHFVGARQQFCRGLAKFSTLYVLAQARLEAVSSVRDDAVSA